MGNCQTISKDGAQPTRSKYSGKADVFIKSYTWSRDSHGLFDYEAKTLTKKNLKTSAPGRILRAGDDVRVIKENEKKNIKEESELMKLIFQDGNVLVDNCRETKDDNKEKPDNLENCDNDLWLVVKSLKTNPNSKGYKLAEGDLIKLGRVKFRIRELRGVPSKNPKCDKNTKIEDDNVSIADSDKKSSSNSPRGGTQSSQTCRICLSESADASDPFFSPCNCTGTMKYIHIKCLQRWLKSKVHTKHSSSSTTIHWKNLECELCKAQYATYFMVEDKRYDIVEFERPECPFVMLDILSKDKNIIRGIHVIKMENKNNIRLGRGHDSDIRITDISVSRCHAFIKLDRGEFYIDDNSSKFGTLVHLKKAFSVPADVIDVSLQIGRTVVALTVKKKKKLLSNCLKPEQHNSSVDEKPEEYERESVDSDGEPPSATSPTNIQRSPLQNDNARQLTRSPSNHFSPNSSPQRRETGVARTENLDNINNLVENNRAYDEDEEEKEEEVEDDNRVLDLDQLNAEGLEEPENPVSNSRAVQDQQREERTERNLRENILSAQPSHQEIQLNQNNHDEHDCDGPVD